MIGTFIVKTKSRNEIKLGNLVAVEWLWFKLIVIIKGYKQVLEAAGAVRGVMVACAVS